MKRSRILAILVACMACLVGFRQSLPDPVELLKKSHAAEKSSSFSGIQRTTVLSGKQRASAEVKAARNGSRSRMEYTSGPSAGTVMIDNGNTVIRLAPSRKTAYVSSAPACPEKLDLLLKNYKPVVTGTAKVAGRDCYVVRVDPKTKGNPWKKLWIDKTSHVILRTERHNCEGEVSMTSEYVKIDYRSRPSAALFSVPKGYKSVKVASGLDYRCAEDVRKAVGFTPLKPGFIPAGYVFDGYCASTLTCGKNCSIGLRYTNGLNSLAVFQCACHGTSKLPRPGQKDGCTLGHSPNAHFARTIVGSLIVNVVGDFDEIQLTKMALSFKPMR